MALQLCALEILSKDMAQFSASRLQIRLSVVPVLVDLTPDTDIHAGRIPIYKHFLKNVKRRKALKIINGK